MDQVTRAKTLRAAQCREGWPLDQEPAVEPGDPDDWQRWLIEKRAETQAERDRAEATGHDTAEHDTLSRELDEEITRAGMRGNVLPGRPARRHRSTRRRQDAPELPRRKVASRTVGRTYTATDAKTFRPSMFVTLTCPSYGRVQSDGTPADPDGYDYGRAGRDALHFAALFDRFMQNLRRFVGYDVQISRPSNRNGGSPRISMSQSGARSRAPSCARCSPPPITRCGGPARQTSASTAATSRYRTNGARPTSIPPRVRFSPPATRRSTPSAPMTNRYTSPGSVIGSTLRPCSPGRKVPGSASDTSPST